MYTSKSWFFIKIVIFYCFLSSAKASCTLGINPYIDMVLTFVVYCFFSKNRCFATNQTTKLASFIIAIGTMWTMHGTSSLVAYPGEFMTVALPCLLINIREDLQIDILRSIIKWLAVLLAISFIYWLFYLSGFNLPHLTKTSYSDFFANGYVSDNYILFQTGSSYEESGILPSQLRFNGVFLEPGHTGTICLLFIIVQSLDFKKWYNKILWFILIATFSTAAYILLFIYLFLNSVLEKKFKLLFMSFFALIALYMFGLYYNNGDNVVNYEIFDKLLNSDRGLEHRFNSDAKFYWNKIWDDGQWLFGLGTSNVHIEHSAGYKVFIISNGILGAFFVVLGYYFIFSTHKSKEGFLYFIMLIVSFLQRVYCYWDAYLDPYILGITYMYCNKLYTKHIKF